jgi:hypothetical protein
MQVQYIGKCNKHDSIRGVGLHWEPGQVRSVTAEVAERLVRYMDTWVRVDAEERKDEQPIGLDMEEKSVEEPLPVIDFHIMDKAALVQFAEREYNERLDKRLSETVLRHKVVALFGKRQAEAE